MPGKFPKTGVDILLSSLPFLQYCLRNTSILFLFIVAESVSVIDLCKGREEANLRTADLCKMRHPVGCPFWLQNLGKGLCLGSTGANRQTGTTRSRIWGRALQLRLFSPAIISFWHLGIKLISWHWRINLIKFFSST